MGFSQLDFVLTDVNNSHKGWGWGDESLCLFVKLVRSVGSVSEVLVNARKLVLQVTLSLSCNLMLT